MPSNDVDESSPDVRAIVQIARDFSTLVAEGNLERVVGYYSPDVVYMSPGVPDAIGRDAVAKNWQALLSSYSVRVKVRVVEVKILGDYAYDRASFMLTLTPKSGGKKQQTGGRVFEVLRKEQGKWKSLRVMVNSDK